ncbi:MAG: sigma 54-interacting transcriptional regulator [Phycisphaerae bacterium]
MIVQDTQYLLSFAEGFIEAHDYRKLIDAVYRITADRLQFTRLNIVLFNEKEHRWRRVARRNRMGHSIQSPCDEGPITDDIRTLAAVYNKSAQVIDDYHTDNDAQCLPSYGEEGLSSGIHTFLLKNGNLIGMFSVQHTELAFYSAKDAPLVFEIGQIVAGALDKIGTYQEPVDKVDDATQANREAESTHHSDDYEDIIGSSMVMRRLLEVTERVASTGATVLILGETGTGKELIAQAIHARSRRQNKRFVTVNCAALASELVSSELFGHEAGAFTGATGTHKGRFELANGGTLLLDEIGDIPMETQVRLLRILEEGEFERVGSVKTLKTDVRIIAATHRNLEQMVKSGQFRADLLFRLNAFPIHIPPLRDRGDDVTELAQFFVRSSAERICKPIPIITEEVIRSFKRYRWVGNVRELRNIIERAVILCDNGHIKSEHLPMDIAFGGSGAAPQDIFGIGYPSSNNSQPALRSLDNAVTNDDSRIDSLEDATRKHIIRALNRCNGKVSGNGGAAHILNLKPKTLESKMRKLGIHRHWR